MTSWTFQLQPTAPLRLDLTAWTLRRRPDNMVDRWDGTTYRRVLQLSAGLSEIAVTQPNASAAAPLHVTVSGQTASHAVRSQVEAALERLLGLHVDLTNFYQLAAGDPQLGALAERFRGMKPPRMASVFECAINAMACQQVTLTLGIRLLNRLASAHGSPLAQDTGVVHAFPAAADLAGLRPSDLRELGFSHQKGRAMIELSQAVVEGHIDLEALVTVPDDEAVRRLCTMRGIGRWSAEYILLRGLGRTHIFPGDDVGARKNLQRWLRLATPLNYEAVRQVQSRWVDYSGLVYFHLLLAGLDEAGYLSNPCDTNMK